jgi:hypothetical protein
MEKVVKLLKLNLKLFIKKKPLVFYKPIYPLQPFGDLLKQNNMMRN